MKRISPQSVVDAYIATGMYPVFRKWGTLDKQGGCALTTIGTAEGCYKHPCSNGNKHRHYSQRLGIDYRYLMGFVQGFDNGSLIPAGETYWDDDGMVMSSEEQFVQGQRDGWDARAAVKQHFRKLRKAEKEAMKSTILQDQPISEEEMQELESAAGPWSELHA